MRRGIDLRRRAWSVLSAADEENPILEPTDHESLHFDTAAALANSAAYETDWTAVEVDGAVYASSSHLAFTAQATVADGDLGLYHSGQAKEDLLTLVVKVRLTTLGVGGFGFKEAANVDFGTGNVWGIEWDGSGNLYALHDTTSTVIGTVSAATDYHFAVVIDGADVKYYSYAGSWVLEHTETATPAATLYAAYYNNNAVYQSDFARVVTLGANSDAARSEAITYSAAAYDENLILDLYTAYKPSGMLDAGGTVAESGEKIATWDDTQDTTDLVQATDGNRPTKQAGGAARFDDASSQYIDGNFAANQTQPTTMIVDIHPDDSVGSRHPIDAKDGTNRQTHYFASNTWRVFAGTDFNTAIATDTVRRRNAAVFNGASSKFYQNAVLRATGNAGAGGSDSLRLGANTTPASFYSGDIYSFLFVSREVEVWEIAIISTWLASL